MHNGGIQRRGSAARLVSVLLALLTALAWTAVTAPASAGASTPRTASSFDYQSATAYQMNSAHSGVSPDLVGPKWNQSWTVDLGPGTSGGTVGYPVIAGGRIFVIVQGGSAPGLYALDEATGTVDWGPQVLGGTYGAIGLTYDNGHVFTVNSSGLMVEWNAADGSQGWSVSLPGQYLFSAAPTASGGVVYEGGAGTGGTLYAVSEASGAVLWTGSVMNGDESSPVVGPDGVYVSYACDQTYKFAFNGALIWHYATGCEGGGGQTAVLANGKLYLHDIVLDAATGTLDSAFATATAPAVDSSNAYVRNGSNLQAVHGSTTLWTFSGDGTLAGSPIEVGSTVYIGSTSGHVYGVNSSTGAEVWTATLSGSIASSSYFFASGIGEGDGLLAVPSGPNITVFAPATLPSAVATVSATAGNTQATVAWQVPPDPGDPISQFQILSTCGSGAPTSTLLPAGATGSPTDPTPGAADSATISSLANGTPCTFTVAAVNDAGAGPMSAPSNRVVPSTTPATPAAPTAVAGDQDIQLAWTVPDDGGLPITSFTVTPNSTGTPLAPQSVAAGAGVSATPGAVDTVMLPIPGGTTATYTVAAVNADGTGATSPASNSVTTASGPIPPFAPTAVSAVAGHESASVTWTVGSANGSPITAFTITPLIGGSPGTPLTVAAGAVGSSLDPTPGATDSDTVGGLTDGTAVAFTVAATNATGTGAASTPSGTVTPTNVPSSPTNVVATTSNGLVHVAWTDPASTGGLALTAIDVVASSGATYSGAPSSTSASIAGLTLGQPVSFTVVAVNADGDGAPSSPSNSVTPTTVPTTPAAPTASDGGPGPSSTEYATLTWTVPADGGLPITSFTISVTRNGSPSAPVIATVGSGGVSGTPGAVDTLRWLDEQFGSTYSYTVSATNADGSSAQSIASNQLHPVTVPGTPAAPSAVAGPGEALLTWTVPPDGGSPITSYVIQVTRNGQGLPPLAVSVASTGISATPGASDLVAITGLTQGIPYTFTLEAVNAVGTGSASSPSNTVVPTAAPSGSGAGYTMATADGQVLVFGADTSYGSLSGIHLNEPIVGMARTPDGGGYWLVASDGGIFAFGDAGFHGSTGAIHLNKPIVGMASTPDGKGYWLVASDGGIFAFGDAGFHGSTGAVSLSAPVVGIVATADGAGYWLVTAAGAAFAYGDAPFLGSAAPNTLTAPVVDVT